MGFPSSRVMSRARLSLLASTMRLMAAMARPRTGAGTSAQEGWARLAAAHAEAKVAPVARETSATTSSSRAGLVEVRTPAAAPVAGRPPAIEAIFLVMLVPPCWLAPTSGSVGFPRGGTRDLLRGEPVEGALDRLASDRQFVLGDGQGRTETDGPRPGRQQQDPLPLPQDGQQRVALGGARQVEGAHQPASADIRDQAGEAGGQLLQLAQEPVAGGGGLVEHPVALDDLQQSAGADHVHQAPAPGRVDPAADLEHVVRDLFHAAPGHDPSELDLLAEGHDVGLEPELLVGPRRAGRA